MAGFDCAALALASVASADPRPAAAFLRVLRRLVAFGVADCGNYVFLLCGCLGLERRFAFSWIFNSHIVLKRKM